MSDTFDVAIIGAGPSGYVGAIRAGQLGLKAVVIDKNPDLGGVCLNWGCIPTKALIRNAELVELMTRHADDFGFTVKGFEASWPKAVERAHKVKGRMNKGVAGLLKKNGVTVITGTASFRDAHTLEIEVEGGQPTTIEAKNVIVGTGSHSRMLPGLTPDGRRVITSRHAVSQTERPAKLLVAGAGAVGMEFAYIYNAYGSQVTVLEMMDRVLPAEDPEASQVVANAFSRRGVDLRLGTKVEKVEVRDNGVRVTVSAGGKEETLEGDQILVAIARAPNTEGLGLEKAGVTLNERGWIQADATGQTSAPGVWAIGDVAGPPMLAHKASHEGVAVAERIAGLNPHAVDATYIPMCTYCQPQVASVGLSEARAREAGHEVHVSSFPWVGIGKAVAIGETVGFVKLVSDARTGEILGGCIVGPEATEIIHEIVLARTAELTPAELVATIHAHPTLSEGIHEAALGLEGAALHI